MLRSKLRSNAAIAAMALLVALCVGCAANQVGAAPLAEMRIVYEDDPASFLPTLLLKWDDKVYHDITAYWLNPISRGYEIGYARDEYSDWRVFELEGHGRNHLLIYEGDSEDVFRVMSIYPPERLGTFILENVTDQERFTRLLSVTLYKDGMARLATPPISSFLLTTPYFYTFIGDELLIYYESDNIIARFEVIGGDTLVLKRAYVPLFADPGARFAQVYVDPA